MKLHVLERLASARQRQFAFGSAVGVVEHRPRHASPGDLTQVLDGQCGGEPALAGTDDRRLEVEQVEDFPRAGHLALDHCSSWFDSADSCL
jgi:hypothetical protein